MAQIHVCPLNCVDMLIAEHRPSHVVTLINREMMIDTPAGIRPENHLRLGMNDIAAPTHGFVAPGDTHVADLVRFALGWD
ncbi:MAG TPA: tyrosine protein phosphatase, partial [Hyphomicrobiales bacterium]|nr:tyrosine protein phosphatase [Hyphomicrobiales bacterium]